jgi:hypothetical protein
METIGHEERGCEMISPPDSLQLTVPDDASRDTEAKIELIAQNAEDNGRR